MKSFKPDPALLRALAGGAAGAVIVIALWSAPILWKSLKSISAGDWLQALSGVVGVSATIWATLWLEERKRLAQRRAEQRLLHEALVLLQAAVPAAAKPLDATKPFNERRLTTIAHFELIRAGLQSLAYAREGFRIPTYNLWKALDTLDTVVALSAERIAREERLVRGDHISEAVLAISREHLEAFAQEAMQPINGTMMALGEASR